MARTGHGYHIPGSPMSTAPDSVAKCLGVWGCVYCMREAAAWVKKNRDAIEDLEKTKDVN